MNNEILRFLKYDRPRYIHERKIMVNGSFKLVDVGYGNSKEIFELLKYMPNADLHVMLFPTDMLCSGKFDMIYFDVDGDITNVLRNLKGNGFNNFRLYFSGRNYNIYIDLNEMLDVGSIENMRKVNFEFAKKIGIYNDIDKQPLWMYGWAVKLPYTKSVKNGLYAIEIDESIIGEEKKYAEKGIYREFYKDGIKTNDAGMIKEIISEVIG